MTGLLSIENRPRIWAEVVGQDRPIGVLQKVLSSPRFRPRGVIFEGPSGVGKTTTAYITAKALLCTGGGGVGCNTCPSCLLFNQSPEAHPDFKEVDAASNSGVDASRRIIEESIELPVVASRRVILIDEAHRLSRDAWDVYLKPLETPTGCYTFLFCTTDPGKILDTVKGRCFRAPFTNVSPDALTGLLVSTALQHHIPYELDGLRALAKQARGSVRRALQFLDKASCLGTITREAAGAVSDAAFPDMAMDALHLISVGKLPEAVDLLERMAAMKSSASAVIEELFTTFAQVVFDSTDQEDQLKQKSVKLRLPDVAKVTEIFIKWSASSRIPLDALALFAFELSESRNAPGERQPSAPTTTSTIPWTRPVVSNPTPQAPSTTAPKAGGANSVEDMAKLLSATQQQQPAR